jgi:hypothetical protein
MAQRSRPYLKRAFKNGGTSGSITADKDKLSLATLFLAPATVLTVHSSKRLKLNDANCMQTQARPASASLGKLTDVSVSRVVDIQAVVKSTNDRRIRATTVPVPVAVHTHDRSHLDGVLSAIEPPVPILQRTYEYRRSYAVRCIYLVQQAAQGHD